MNAFFAHEGKHQFGQLIDTARAESVVVEKYRRPVAPSEKKHEEER